MLKRASCLVLVVLPALADVIPAYRYFYTCDSGVEDCVAFDRNQNNYGDFGMANVLPTNWGTFTSDCWVTYTSNCFGGFRVLMSNQEGEVIGKVDTTTGGALAYGSKGQVTCVIGFCNDGDWVPRESTTTACTCSTQLSRRDMSRTVFPNSST